MRVSVDLDICQGHGTCHTSAPEVFDLDENDGRSIVIADPVPPELEGDARRGADSCPERAITVSA